VGFPNDTRDSIGKQPILQPILNFFLFRPVFQAIYSSLFVQEILFLREKDTLVNDRINRSTKDAPGMAGCAGTNPRKVVDNVG
jgi:hypothetical protein